MPSCVIKNYFWEVMAIIVIIPIFCDGGRYQMMDNSKAAPHIDVKQLSIGDKCTVDTGEAGVCKMATNCEPHMSNTMRYSIRNRCTFVERGEVICCPTPPAPVSEGPLGWKSLISPNHGPSTVKKVNQNSRNQQEKPTLSVGDICTLITGEDGVCKITKECEPITNNAIQYSEQNRCTFTVYDEVTCCPMSPTTGTKHGSKEMSPSKAACQRYEGYNEAQSSPKIHGGRKVEVGQFPHIGALISERQTNDGPELENFCGTVLISERYALTAAHCVNSLRVEQKIKIRFGVVNWIVPEDDNALVDVNIEKIIIHDDYRFPKKNHDIAILKFAHNVTFSGSIFPACLYTDVEDISSNQPLVIAGWGVIDYSKLRSDNLLMTTVKTYPIQECSKKIKPLLDNGQYCAHDPNYRNDSCTGDSGGPLQLNTNIPTRVIGIVSFGESCATATPSVYVRVAYYLKWIEDIVWPSKKDD